MLAGCIRLADGSIAFVCASRISLVPALAASVPAPGFDPADHHLDGKRHTHLLRLASARTWPSVDTSWLDYDAGIWVGRGGRCSYRVAPDETSLNTSTR